MSSCNRQWIKAALVRVYQPSNGCCRMYRGTRIFTWWRDCLSEGPPGNSAIHPLTSTRITFVATRRQARNPDSAHQNQVWGIVNFVWSQFRSRRKKRSITNSLASVLLFVFSRLLPRRYPLSYRLPLLCLLGAEETSSAQGTISFRVPAHGSCMEKVDVQVWTRRIRKLSCSQDAIIPR